MSEPLDLSRVKLWASIGPVDPMLWPDPKAAAGYFTQHRPCFEQWQTLVGVEVRATGKPCPLGEDHASPVVESNDPHD